jgi:cobyrinic acid a,c-diamide synthase
VRKRNPFYPKGTVLKGHEFHYSGVAAYRREPGVGFAFSMQRGEGLFEKMDGICYKNVLATYTHLHAYGSPAWAEGMIRAAGSYRRTKEKYGTKR